MTAWPTARDLTMTIVQSSAGLMPGNVSANSQSDQSYQEEIASLKCACTLTTIVASEGHKILRPKTARCSVSVMTILLTTLRTTVVLTLGSGQGKSAAGNQCLIITIVFQRRNNEAVSALTKSRQRRQLLRNKTYRISQMRRSTATILATRCRFTSDSAISVIHQFDYAATFDPCSHVYEYP